MLGPGFFPPPPMVNFGNCTYHVALYAITGEFIGREEVYLYLRGLLRLRRVHIQIGVREVAREGRYCAEREEGSCPMALYVRTGVDAWSASRRWRAGRAAQRAVLALGHGLPLRRSRRF